MYSPWSPHALTHWHHGSGCGRAAGCSCAPLQLPAPPRPPPSAPGRPAAWALRRGRLKAHSIQHHPPDTTAQGMAPWGSPSRPAPTAQGSPGDTCQGRGIPALPWPEDASTYLGTGGQQPVPRATSSLQGQGVSGWGDRGCCSRACRRLTWHPLLLAQPLASVRVGVRCDTELRARRRLKAPEGHPALGRKTTTTLWQSTGSAGTHLPRARGTGPPCHGDVLVPESTLPSPPVPGTPIPGTPHLRTRGWPGTARARGAQTSMATQREEAYACPESTSSPVTFCWDEVVPSTSDHCPASSLSSGPRAPRDLGRRGWLVLVRGGRARRRRTSRQGEQAAGPVQRSAGSSRSRARASPWPGPSGSIPHSMSVSGGGQKVAVGTGSRVPGWAGGRGGGTYPGGGRRGPGGRRE